MSTLVYQIFITNNLTHYCFFVVAAIIIVVVLLCIVVVLLRMLALRAEICQLKPE